MEDTNYEIGMLKAKVDRLTETVKSVEEDVSVIKDTVLTWKSTAAGVLTVLSVIGAFILYFADALIQYVKLKLGF